MNNSFGPLKLVVVVSPVNHWGYVEVKVQVVGDDGIALIEWPAFGMNQGGTYTLDPVYLVPDFRSLPDSVVKVILDPEYTEVKTA